MLRRARHRQPPALALLRASSPQVGRGAARTLEIVENLRAAIDEADLDERLEDLVERGVVVRVGRIQ